MFNRYADGSLSGFYGPRPMGPSPPPTLSTIVQMIDSVSQQSKPSLLDCGSGVGVGVAPGSGGVCPLWADQRNVGATPYTYYIPKMLGKDDSGGQGNQGAVVDAVLRFQLQTPLDAIGFPFLPDYVVQILKGAGVPYPPDLSQLPKIPLYVESSYFTLPGSLGFASPLPGTAKFLLQAPASAGGGGFTGLTGLGADGLLRTGVSGNWNDAGPVNVGVPSQSSVVYISPYELPWMNDPVISAWNSLASIGIYVPLLVTFTGRLIQSGYAAGNSGCGSWIALQSVLHGGLGLANLDVKKAWYNLFPSGCTS